MNEFDWTNYVLIPCLIFLGRVVDVTLGTLRIISVSRGRKLLSALLGFFEVFIWLLAIGEIFKNLDGWPHLLAYSAGFATGNYVGIWLESKLAMGMNLLRVITRHGATELVETLHREDLGCTVVQAEGAFGPVQLLFMALRRKDVPKALGLIKKFNPSAFFTLEDVRGVSHGIFPTRSFGLGTLSLRPTRKGK